MANLPAIRWDTGPQSNAANLLVRGAEAQAQGNASLGQAFAQGGTLLGGGIARGKARREDKAYRQQRDARGDFENDRVFEMRRLEGAAKMLEDEVTEAGMDYQMAQAGAMQDPAAMLDPQFKATEERYQSAIAKRQSLQAQFETVGQGQAQTPTHRHTKG